MASHWTYESFAESEDLAQGDVLEPTEELREVLKIVHAHFLNDKYTAFIVLSQSCDLVRRSGTKGHPITLGVVRELQPILPDLLQKVCGSELHAVFDVGQKLEARRFLERLINQNEQGFGLFYLHPDADAGVGTPCVAMLRVSIALRFEHYDCLCRARRGRLKAEFQAKLGWLVGNLFSRVGTPDWSDPPARKKEQRKLVENLLDGLTGMTWASEAAIKAAVKAGADTSGMAPETRSNAMKAFEPRPPKDLLLDELARILAAADLSIPGETQERVLKRIPNDASLASLLRRLR